VELALGPVGDEVVAAESRRHFFEQRAHDEGPGKVFDVHDLKIAGTDARGQSRARSSEGWRFAVRLLLRCQRGRRLRVAQRKFSR
jgi:hypothetical protein